MAAARVWETTAAVRTAHPMVRWLPINKLHLTLVFLGETDPSRIEALAAAVEGVAGAHQPFYVATGDAGGRVGGRRDGVAWLRLAEGGYEVAQLSLDVDDAIGSHTFDARNAPRPHLTLARRATQGAIDDLRTVSDRIQLGWTVEQIVLFRSYTGPGGSRYEQLASATLGTSP